MCFLATFYGNLVNFRTPKGSGFLKCLHELKIGWTYLKRYKRHFSPNSTKRLLLQLRKAYLLSRFACVACKYWLRVELLSKKRIFHWNKTTNVYFECKIHLMWIHIWINPYAYPFSVMYYFIVNHTRFYRILYYSILNS